MTRIPIEIHDTVVDVYNKIKDIDDTGVEIIIPTGSVLFDNAINIKLLKKLAQKGSRVLTLTTEDPQGKLLIDMGEEGILLPTLPYEEYTPKESIFSKLREIKLPKLPTGAEPKPKLGAILALIAVGVAVGLTFLILQKNHKAEVKVVVEAQTLTRSITVSVKKDAPNDFEGNIIKGSVLQETVQDQLTIPTTGEKITGAKSKGEVTVYNKTAENKTIKKGSILAYDDGDNEYKYELLDDVEVPARIDDPDPSATIPTIYGEKKVDIEALEIGSEYDMDKDQTLKFDDYKSSEFVAKAETDINGGKKETNKAVGQEDLDKLAEDLLAQNTQSAQNLLENQKNDEIKYIKGSEDTQVIKEEYTNDLGEEAEEVGLDQTITTTALSYSQKDLENLLEDALKVLVPEGYEMSEKDKDIKVEILGNSTDSVLNTAQADIQVTIKIYIVPVLDEQKLKEELVGKSVEEAQKVISSVNNVKTYEISVVPTIFKKFPSNSNNISISVEKE